jgi:hypothetical protein
MRQTNSNSPMPFGGCTTRSFQINEILSRNPALAENVPIQLSITVDPDEIIAECRILAEHYEKRAKGGGSSHNHVWIRLLPGQPCPACRHSTLRPSSFASRPSTPKRQNICCLNRLSNISKAYEMAIWRTLSNKSLETKRNC